jgi:hypothetical protein
MAVALQIEEFVFAATALSITRKNATSVAAAR